MPRTFDAGTGVPSAADLLGSDGTSFTRVSAGSNLTLASGILSAAGGGGSSSLVLISNGTVTDPVSWLGYPDPGISLPVTTYDNFDLELLSLTLSTEDILAGGLSYDDGVSFLCDVLNADSYISAGPRPLMLFTGFSGKVYDGIISIFPGGAVLPARTYADGAGLYAGVATLVPQCANVNLAATVSPPNTRATTLRVVPYGNGDLDPPTTTETFTGGSWKLWGRRA